MMRKTLAYTVLLTLGTIGAAVADTKVTVQPAKARPGDAVLVTVTGNATSPKGTANGHELQFFRARTGYQAVFAIPLDAKPDAISVEIESAVRPATVTVVETKFPEASLVVEDELANPAKADRARIDADNAAILAAIAKAKGDPLFTRPFRKPPGAVSSPFGEWRTFNDGHRSQHLGMDVPARENAPVKAINAGKVVLVRNCFLAGNVVVVAHGGGIASTYYHLNQTSVDEGSEIPQGAEIGLAGQTGRTTGPHLHLSVHVPGGFVDPVRFFQLKLAPAIPTVSTGTPKP